MKNTFLILIVVFIGLTACKKDEVTEPQVSKDDLLCQEWKVNKEFINGVENQYLLEQYYNFKKDGTGISEVHVSEVITLNIKWRWVNDMESIEIIKISDNKAVFDWTKYNILKLTKDELTFEVDYGDETIKLELSKNI